MCLVTVKYKSVVYTTIYAPHELTGLIIPASTSHNAMYGVLNDRGPLIIGSASERPHIHPLYQFIYIKQTGMLHSKRKQTLLTKYKRIISFFSLSQRNVTHHLAQYCVAWGEGPAQQMDRCNFSSIKLWFIVQHSNPRLHTTLCTDSYETLYFHYHSPDPRQSLRKKKRKKTERNKNSEVILTHVMSTSMLNRASNIATVATSGVC